MPVNVDLECSACGDRLYDVWSDQQGQPHVPLRGKCKGVYERLWTIRKSHDTMPHLQKDKCILLYSEKEKNVAYPADHTVPKFMADRGYRQIEVSPREMLRMEKTHGVVSRAMNFDRNGRGT